MKVPLLLTFIFVLGVGQAAAQASEEVKQSRIGINLGYSFTGYREYTDLSINRYLNTFTVIIDGNTHKGNLLHSFNAGFFMGENDAVVSFSLDTIWQDPLEPGNEYFTYYQTNHTFIRGYAEYALDHRLWGTPVFPGYLGGSIRSDMYLLQTLNNYLFANLTVLLSLNLHISQKWVIDQDNILVLALSIPVLGYAIRPNYIGFILPLESGFASIHNYRAVFGDVKYHHAISDLLSFNAGLGFEISHITFPRPRRDAIFRLSTGVSFSF